jgi:hypothetical protein
MPGGGYRVQTVLALRLHTGGASNRLKSIVMQRRNPAALGKGFVRKMN